MLYRGSTFGPGAGKHNLRIEAAKNIGIRADCTGEIYSTWASHDKSKTLLPSGGQEVFSKLKESCWGRLYTGQCRIASR